MLDTTANVAPGSIAAMSRNYASMAVAWASNTGALGIQLYENGGWIPGYVLGAGSVPTNTKIAALARSSARMNFFYIGPNNRVQADILEIRLAHHFVGRRSDIGHPSGHRRDYCGIDEYRSHGGILDYARRDHRTRLLDSGPECVEE